MVPVCAWRKGTAILSSIGPGIAPEPLDRRVHRLTLLLQRLALLLGELSQRLLHHIHACQFRPAL